MRSLSVSLPMAGLFLLFCACDKKDDAPVLQKGLRGRVIHSSCATIAIQVLDREIGTTWYNCHDQQTYRHVIGATLNNTSTVQVVPGAVFTFDIVEGMPAAQCFLGDCVPAESAYVRIRED